MVDIKEQLDEEKQLEDLREKEGFNWRINGHEKVVSFDLKELEAKGVY